MEIWNSPYYMHSRLCLKPFGLWPFQSSRIKFAFRLGTALAVSTILIPYVVKAYELRHHLHQFLLCMPSILYFSHFLTKFLHIILRGHKARHLMESVGKDFLYFKGESLGVLHHFSEEARKFNTFYMIYLCSTVGLYNLMAFMPHMLDIVMPLNESRPRQHVRFVRYHVAELDQSFYFILVHGLIIDIVAIFTIIGFDTIVFNCAQHACALFQIVVVELQNSIKVSNLNDLHYNNLKRRQNLIYRRIANSIITHKHALEYAENLESMCAIVNLLVVSITLGTATFTEFETIVHKGNFEVMMRYLFFTIAQFLNILYCNWPGQRVRDHSLLVRDSCWELDWYSEDISVEGKKLLILMMLRCQTPSCLTAGGLFVLDLQNFVSIVKTSMSYFAVLMSVQKI